MSEKAKRIAELQDRIPQAWNPPSRSMVEDVTLLEVGLACILTRHLSNAQAEKSLKALSAAYSDWNELRVSQVQEFSGLIKTRSVELSLECARDVKAYLQEVFQKNHGFDIEFLREDPNEAGKFIQQLEHLGASAATYILWMAADGSTPATAGIVRALDRLGVLKRTSSMRKAQEALDALVPEARRAEFGVRYGLIVERWCDAKKPLCWECSLVDVCAFGQRVEREWKAQQKRLELQRQRDEERRRREEERERKRAAAEAHRRALKLEKEAAKRRRAEEKRAREEALRKSREQAEKKKVAEKKKAEAKKKAELKRKADAKKKAEARKKAAAKKAEAKKAAKKPAAKKPATKKPATKATKKPATKATKKVATKKKPTRKPAKKSTATKNKTSRGSTGASKKKSNSSKPGSTTRKGGATKKKTTQKPSSGRTNAQKTSTSRKKKKAGRRSR